MATEIILYGIIGEPGLDAASVTAAIRSAKGPISVRINSPGGYVFEGLPIYEALAAYPDTVTVYVDGLAASMASVIAMAGSEIIMAESSLQMAHRPWEASIGHADDLRKDAAKLDKIEAQLVGIYARRTGIPEADISAMLAIETWLTAAEAVEQGFATSISPTLKIAAMADVSACGFRKIPTSMKGPSAMTTKTENQPAQAVLDERNRVATINSLITKHGLPTEMGVQLVASGTALDLARETVLNALADRTDSYRIGNSHYSSDGTMDNPNFAAKAIGDAIYSRLSGKAVEGPAAEMRGLSLVELAGELLTRTGRAHNRRMRPDEILNAAAWRGSGPRNVAIMHGTGDFPDLLQGAGQRFLMETFEAVGSPLKLIGRQRSAKDFRAISGLQMSSFGTLPALPENAEIQHGTFTTRKESYSLQTFAKQFSLSRQAIINDDLGAFSDPLVIMARAAAETEAVALAALINSNPTMGDGVALFHASHGNLGAGAAPSVASLDLGRQAMRTQKDLDKVTWLNISPKYVVSSPGVETAIEQIVSMPLTPNQSSQTNPFAGRLTPLVDPRLTGTAWYLFADPTTAPVLEYAYLGEGEPGPIVEMQNGWDVLGTSFRVYEDFGAGLVDHRGAYKYPASS